MTVGGLTKMFTVIWITFLCLLFFVLSYVKIKLFVQLNKDGKRKHSLFADCVMGKFSSSLNVLKKRVYPRPELD